MKSTTCLHLKSPLRKRGVERAKLKFKNYFLDLEFDMDWTIKIRISKSLKNMRKVVSKKF